MIETKKRNTAEANKNELVFEIRKENEQETDLSAKTK